MRFVKMMFAMLCVPALPIRNVHTSGSAVKSVAANASLLRAKSFRPNAKPRDIFSACLAFALAEIGRFLRFTLLSNAL
jgi:hypothetical protein